MDKRQKLYEGKAKIVYATDDPALVIQYFKDDATAFNAQKRGTIVGKGVVNNLMSAAVFEMLAAKPPDVLISDIEMPGEDGYSLIRRVRALDPAKGGRTPAIALTAYGRREDRLNAISAGFSMHVPKPVDPVELTTLVAGLALR